MDIIIDENGISDDKKDAIKNSIINNKVFPFYYEISTTPKFPFFVHTLSKRNNNKVEINSSAYHFFYDILENFCKKNSIKFKHVIRAAINATFSDHRYPHLDPHVDFDEKHRVVIMYLNDVSQEENYNSTLIFDKKYKKKKTPLIYDVDNLSENFPIKEEVKPKFGKIISFDGSYYHTIKSPNFGEVRFICIFNII